MAKMKYSEIKEADLDTIQSEIKRCYPFKKPKHIKYLSRLVDRETRLIKTIQLITGVPFKGSILK